MQIFVLFWIVNTFLYHVAKCQSNIKGIDIGYNCIHDSQCTTGNGGEYSKCNKDLNICICTINHLGEDKCLKDSNQFYGVCRRKTFYTETQVCTLECSPKGTRRLRKGHDWYGEILHPFASFKVDKTTSACYDPKRAFNTVPSGFEIKQSSLPGIGLGVFTTSYIEQDAVFGPYKGTFDTDDTDEDLDYAWTISPREDEGRKQLIYVDAIDIALSNWLRYVNTPINAEMENVAAVQYKGEMYYKTIKSIAPGTEMFVWYGESYARYLGLKPFKHPRYNHGEAGYAGGNCDYEDERKPCLHDKNTICAEQYCFCMRGSHYRAGMCYLEGTLGGRCNGFDGETCTRDKNAVCQRGLCVCKNNTLPVNGVCRQDETLGGRCAGSNGETCGIDNNAECVNGLCRCMYGTTVIDGVCVMDETYRGRCIGKDGEPCVKDPTAVCWNKVCKCIEFYSDVNGKCTRDGYFGGQCVEKTCLGKNVVCDKVTNTCTCKTHYQQKDGKCVKSKTICSSETIEKYDYHVRDTCLYVGLDTDEIVMVLGAFTSVWLYVLLLKNYAAASCIGGETGYECYSDVYNQGIDIGYSCTHDVQCTAGNGGEYSKCNKDLNICICTITHLGEDKCMPDSDKYFGVCRKPLRHIKPGFCTLECSPKGTTKWQATQDWYGFTYEPFAAFIHDKKTSVCYDPLRAVNSAPDEIEIKPSTIPNAGFGAFAKMFIEQDTVFAPYKGTFEPESDVAGQSGYSWKIDTRTGEGRANTIWIDAKDVTLSNWLRYVNTPTSAESENVFAFQYKGEMYYQAFKSIQPGTELLVWYGDSYGEFLEIERFNPPKYYSAQSGYAGGPCHEDEEGLSCFHDDHAVCADKTCFCMAGTHIRAGKCIPDETLGGVCSGLDGETCRYDINAECRGGVCVCRNNSSPANGACRQDESFGGRCRGKDGQTCMRDDNAECVHGLCRCKYGTTAIGKTCLKDETYGGRCSGADGDDCEQDSLAKCLNTRCVCKVNSTLINGKCTLDEKVGGRCRGGEGSQCMLEINGVCKDGLCSCKADSTYINGTCRSDGALEGICINGSCRGNNVKCDTITNICGCKSTHFINAGKCVKK
ncbi:uncharacterized protein LOC132719555 [Ruditapes philippinarum]|uniref:uncharacterized protein LOC132719555 n=1 Tax=Ruditapes philippinarum TaxID=129788 RepID=UPI00295A6AEC|nr:uncharacterized protein LOC132719555 [Ruditapes philippinarum]